MTTQRVTTTPSESWSTDTHSLRLNDQPVQIAGREPFRTSLLIVNDADSAGDVYVLPQLGRSVGGYRIKPGAGLTLYTVGAVHAYCKVGAATAYTVSESGSC